MAVRGARRVASCRKGSSPAAPILFGTVHPRRPVNAANYADLSDRQIHLVQQLSRRGRHNREVGILVRREPTSDARRGSCVVQLLASSRGFPMPSGRRSVDDAKQCADGKWMA